MGDWFAPSSGVPALAAGSAGAPGVAAASDEVRRSETPGSGRPGRGRTVGAGLVVSLLASERGRVAASERFVDAARVFASAVVRLPADASGAAIATPGTAGSAMIGATGSAAAGASDLACTP